MAYGSDCSDPDGLARRDVAAIQARGGALSGTGRPLVVTSGTLVLTAGKMADERQQPDPGSPAAMRIRGEQAGVPLKQIAEQIGDVLGVPTRSMTREEISDDIGNPFLALVPATGAPASSQLTREMLDGNPIGKTLLRHMRTSDPFDPQLITRTEKIWGVEHPQSDASAGDRKSIADC